MESGLQKDCMGTKSPRRMGTNSCVALSKSTPRDGNKREFDHSAGLDSEWMMTALNHICRACNSSASVNIPVCQDGQKSRRDK